MKQQPKTRDRILQVTQDLIQKSGYSAISFADIALAVGIKKPSIVHHFPNKGALVEAVVIQYSEFFETALKNVMDDASKNSHNALDFAFMPYRAFGEEENKICLCGALAGEYTALPENVQKQVMHFFDMKQTLLKVILEQGLNNAELSFTCEPEKMAQHILHSLQGSLIIKRATGQFEHIENTIEIIKQQIKL